MAMDRGAATSWPSIEANWAAHLLGEAAATVRRFLRELG
jgi:hypothetical protein